ncbi:PREDICTED: PI-PLC X domain-containing protein At5g67130 isoform X1 [Prunus mume]|uniref:PI-PLC X domain-containing protein At5g67130 isoform X1 n=1 Tax=Prunus mume TaxID=102107 RepID=A0ABM1LP35_PRUMU|nr:PREDICTED: PI-PLC X domain-containing protein At5g67130 isoform X1 [Prunus mume]
MKTRQNLLLMIIASAAVFSFATACSNGQCKLLEQCSSDGDCEAGLFCFSCPEAFSGSRCIRSTITDQFKLLNNSLPFNKYAFLTTHNAFAIEGEPSHTGIPRVTFTNQEDTITQQLNNGVRALMLDTYDFKGDVWLCHSFNGKCHDITAFEPAIDTLMEIEAFLSANPAEIVTLILEDYVEAPNGLTNVFKASGLMKYWFPVTSMPKNGQDWPLVSDMVAKNQRLLVFTSKSAKEQSEGIAYQWNYMVENQCKNPSTNFKYFSFSLFLSLTLNTDGDGGMKPGNCPNRRESAPLNDETKSLVLVNYFTSIPIKQVSCAINSGDLIKMLYTCYGAAGNRWANFVAVDFYKRSEGGGSFQALDTLNGELLCGCNDVHACVPGSTPGSCQP